MANDWIQKLVAELDEKQREERRHQELQRIAESKATEMWNELSKQMKSDGRAFNDIAAAAGIPDRIATKPSSDHQHGVLFTNRDGDELHGRPQSENSFSFDYRQMNRANRQPVPRKRIEVKITAEDENSLVLECEGLRTRAVSEVSAKLFTPLIRGQFN